MQGFADCLEAAGQSVQVVGHPTLFDVVFTSEPVENYRDVLRGNNNKAVYFNATLRKNGILRVPGKFYISLALTDDDVAKTLTIVDNAANSLPY
jgi:glutamate-1-semialdehyde 2,1-aminomutase